MKKLMDVVGPAFTKEIFFSARHFDTDEALAMRLINRAVEAGGLEALVRSNCSTVSENAPLTMQTLKRTVAALLHGSDGDIAACDRLVAARFDSQDFFEGRRAFMEKRRPVFHGT